MIADPHSTETNSADESKGRTFGLEGDLFAVVAITGFGAISLFTLLFTIFQVGCFIALLLVLPPTLLILGWVFGLRQNRPPGFDFDWFEQLTSGSGWGFNPQQQPSRSPVRRP